MKNNKKGFTLAELLIVIAIMAILIAIAIPVFSAQLEKAREAVDDNSERAAKSMAEAHFLLAHADGKDDTGIALADDKITVNFVEDGQGNLVISKCSGCTKVAEVTGNAPDGSTYKAVTAKCTCPSRTDPTTGAARSHTGGTLSVEASKDGVIAKW